MSEIGTIEKDATNNFHKYRYASEFAIKKALNPLLIKHGVLFKVDITDHKQHETLTVLNLGYRFIDVESGEELSGVFVGSGEDKGDKGVYKAITGAIKYIITSSFLIPTGDDPEKELKPEAKPKTKTEKGFVVQPKGRNEEQDNINPPF